MLDKRGRLESGYNIAGDRFVLVGQGARQLGMKRMNETIVIKPTYEEAGRISAYVLAAQSNGRPEDFLDGTYWDATELAAQRAIATWNAVRDVADALEVIGVDFFKESKSFKAKIIKAAFTKICAELTEAEARPEGWEF